MAQHDRLHDEGVGDKLKDAARTVKDKLAGKANDDSMRDDSMQDESVLADTPRADSDRRLTRSEEELAVGTRRTPAGEVRVHESVKTEHVRQEVPVMREEVVIERHAVADGMRADDADSRSTKRGDDSGGTGR